MRFVTRLLVLTCLAAAVLVPAAAAADRMWVGFHDDPMLRYDGAAERRCSTRRATHERDDRANARRRGANVAPTRPANATDPFDPAYHFDDLDEFVRNAQAARHGGADHDLGHAEVGERRQDAELPADEAWPTSRTSRGRSPPATPAAIAGYPFVRFFAIWNESNLGNSSWRRSSTRGPDRQPAQLREARRSGLRRASRPAARRRSSRSARRRRTAATRSGGRHDSTRPARSPKLVAAGEPAAQVRRLGASPVSGAGEPEADAERALAERDAHLAATVREGPRQVVRAQEHPGLDHRVRQRDEAGRAEGRHRGAAGGVRRRRRSRIAKKDTRVDMFIWFVLQDSTRQPLAERRLPEDRRGQARAAEVRRAPQARSTRVNGKLTRQGRHGEPVRDGLPARVLREQPGRRDGRLHGRRRTRAASSYRAAGQPRRSRSTARSGARRRPRVRRSRRTASRSTRTRPRRPRILRTITIVGA